MLVCVHPQIARKRHKVISTFKSPLGQTRPPAQLKHITLMPLSQIRRVLDLRDTEGNFTVHVIAIEHTALQYTHVFSFLEIFQFNAQHFRVNFG